MFYSKASGFTLLETMVALIVIGISLALVVPHFLRGDDEILKEEASRLASLMEYAADSASSTGHWVAWSPTSGGYRFLERDEEKNVWKPIVSDAPLRERNLPEGIKLTFYEDQQVGKTFAGMVKFSPSGLQVPFRIILSGHDISRVVTGNLMGQVSSTKGAE